MVKGSYNPKKGSAGYALLVALYFNQDTHPNGMKRDELILKANAWSSTPIEYNKEGQVKTFNPMGPMNQNYTGWSSMSSTLIKSHELVEIKRQNRKHFHVLTDKGKELALKLIERDGLRADGLALFGDRNHVEVPAPVRAPAPAPSNKKSRDEHDNIQSRKKAKTEEIFNLADDDDDDDDDVVINDDVVILDDDDDDDNGYDDYNGYVDEEIFNGNEFSEEEIKQQAAMLAEYENRRATSSATAPTTYTSSSTTAPMNYTSSSSSTAPKNHTSSSTTAPMNHSSSSSTAPMNYSSYSSKNNNPVTYDVDDIDNNGYNDNDIFNENGFSEEEIKQQAAILAEFEKKRTTTTTTSVASKESQKPYENDMHLNAFQYADMSNLENTYQHNDYNDDSVRNLEKTLDSEHMTKQITKIKNVGVAMENNEIIIDCCDDSDDDNDDNEKGYDEQEAESEEDDNDKQQDLWSTLESCTEIDKENVTSNNIKTSITMKAIPEFPKCEFFDQYRESNYSALPIGPWWKDGCLTWDHCRQPCPWYLDDFSTMASSSLFIDYFDIILLVTTGENDCITYLNNELKRFQDELRKKKPNCSFSVEARHLNIGDFIWIARYKRDPQYELILDSICERKTFIDFLGSITNNHGHVQSRYISQKRRIMYSGISTRLYLLEGTVATALNSARNSGKHKHLNAEILNVMDVKNRKILNTALAETQLAGFSLVRTDNPKVIKY